MQKYFIGEDLAFVNVRMKRILNIAKGRVIHHEAHTIKWQKRKRSFPNGQNNQTAAEAPVKSRKGNAAQSARRVKDKRLRRACGILDPPCRQCYWAIKGIDSNPLLIRVDHVRL